MRNAVFAAALFLSVPAFAASQKCPVGASERQRVRFRDYVIITTRTEAEGCVEVRKAGELVFSDSEQVKYRVGNGIYDRADLKDIAPGRIAPEIPIGTDITGGGVPNAIVASWSGGAHCCFKFLVLGLGAKFKVIARLDAEDGDLAHFEDINKDGKYEFVANDWTFAYWHASFGGSPAPRVILRPKRYQNSDDYIYELALDLMKKPVPAPAEFQNLVRDIKASDTTVESVYRFPVKAWGAMLDFIYSGHSDLAWKLLDETWPSDSRGEGGFIGAFCEELAGSPYWGDLRPTLKDAPVDCISAHQVN